MGKDGHAQQTSREDRQRIVRLIRALATQEGYNLTALSDVRILRSDRPLCRASVLYGPGVVIVCQGERRGYFGDELCRYDEQHYLVVAVPVPFTTESDATAEHPLLAIHMRLDFRVVADLMIQIDRHEAPAQVDAPRCIMSSPMDSALRVSVLRFLEVMNHPLEAEILGPSLVRELHFRVLTGVQGEAMRAALGMHGQFGKIGKALRRIHATFAQSLDLPQLATDAGMSVAAFHSHFKAITRTSPMQYVKSVRLHHARFLMVRQDMTAEAASHAVGYASPSQFNREFKRLFGRAPAAEVRRMRESFTIPMTYADSDYFFSH
jgi:AraC-like DNA-binding protein